MVDQFIKHRSVKVIPNHHSNYSTEYQKSIEVKNNRHSSMETLIPLL